MIRGIGEDYRFYAKKIGINGDNFLKGFFERIVREGILIDLPSETKPPARNEQKSTVTVEETDETNELLILRSTKED